MSEADPILEAVADLPAHDVDEWRREHIRLAAHRAMEQEPSTFRRVYDRFLEPVSVCGFGVVYLVWAFGRVAMILQ